MPPSRKRPSNRGRPGRRAGGPITPISPAVHPPRRVALPAQGGSAVSGPPRSCGPDGPDHRRAAVPGPARRRSHRRAGCSPRSRCSAWGRARATPICRPILPALRGVPHGDGRRAGRPPAAAVVADAAGRRADRSGRALPLRAGPAEAGFRRAAAGRRGDAGDARRGIAELHFVQVRRGACARSPGRSRWRTRNSPPSREGAVDGLVGSVVLITLWLFLAVHTWRLIVPILLTLVLGLLLTCCSRPSRWAR